MSKKHIAASGVHAGEWVDCGAKVSCTLSSSGEHTTSEELEAVQAYVFRTTGEEISVEMLPKSAVLGYRSLPVELQSGKKQYDLPSEPVGLVWDEADLGSPKKSFVASPTVQVSKNKDVGVERIVCKIDQMKTDFMTHKLLKESFEMLEQNGCTVSYSEKRRLLTVQVKDLEIDGPTDVVAQWQDWVKSAEPVNEKEIVS